MDLKTKRKVDMLIDLLEGTSQEEGYKVKRVSDMNKIYTTADGAIVLRDYEGTEFIVSINLSTKTDRETYVEIGTNYLE